MNLSRPLELREPSLLASAWADTEALVFSGVLIYFGHWAQQLRALTVQAVTDANPTGEERQQINFMLGRKAP